MRASNVPPLSAVQLPANHHVPFAVDQGTYSVQPMDNRPGEFWLNVHSDSGRVEPVATLHSEGDRWRWHDVDDGGSGIQDTIYDAIQEAIAQ